jgi:nitrogen fixation NifU-like protein
MAANDQLYHDLIMDRARNPKHAGRPPAFDAEGEGDNPMCGDRIHVFLKRDGAQVSHEARGCAIMIASADLMADAVAGADVGRIRQLRSAFEAIVNSGAENPSLGALNALGPVSEYRSRIRCATLPWSALAQALEGAE